MKKRTVFGLLALLLWAVPDLSVAEDIMAHFKDGGDLELRPKVSDRITNILWKFDKYLIAEWVNDSVPLHYYERFKDRATLDITSGALVMKKLSTSDEGKYTVEINNKVHPQVFIGKLIEVVPKPGIWVQPLKCNAEMDSCTLKCEKENVVIKDAELVTYEWKEDGGSWKKGGMTMPISKTATAHIKTFTCKMKNPVSEEESDPYENIFYVEPPDGDPGTAVGVTVSLLLLAFAILGVVLWKKKMACFSKRQDEGGATAANGPNPGSPSEYSNVPLKENPEGKTEASERV